MKPEELFELIDGIDDDIILDIPQLNAEKPIEITVKNKRFPLWRYIGTAACVICVLAIGIFAVAKIQGNITTSLPVDTSETVTSSAGTNSSTPNLTSDPVEKKPYYDDVFEKIVGNPNPAVGAPMTYDEIMEMITSPIQTENGLFLDSFYLVETIRALSDEEAQALQGWEDFYDQYTIYEVRILEDLIGSGGGEIDRVEKIIVSHGTPDGQTAGDPSYAPGEKFTALLAKPQSGQDFLSCPSSRDFRYDVVEKDPEIIIYSRGSQLDELGLPGSENINKKVITSTTGNPAEYTQKLDLGYLVVFLRSDWKERRISSHYENLPPATDLGNGVTLTGKLLDRSELEEFSIEEDLENYYFYESEINFLDSLNNPEIKELYKREHRLASIARDSIIWPPYSSKLLLINTEHPYIEGYDENGEWFRYYTTGITYDSFMNEYYKTFTKEAVDKLFQKFPAYSEYNGELMYGLYGGEGLPGRGARSEFEIISNNGSELVFRRTAYPYDLDDIPPGESAPEWFDEDVAYITDFKYVRTADGWRSASIPLGYKKDKDTEFLPGKPGEPNAYLSTQYSTFSDAREKIKFTEVKKITKAQAGDFHYYEITYIMPAGTPDTLVYAFENGTVSVRDNNADIGRIDVDSQHYKKKEHRGVTFWRSLLDETPTVIYISENNIVYIARFKNDDDLTNGINHIMSLY